MNTKEKQKSGPLSRLFALAGRKKGLLVLAGALSALSALGMLVPYGAVYVALRELLLCGGRLSAVDSRLLVTSGWIAFAGLVAALLFLYAALMASHIAAFRLLYGLRVRLTEHIGRLSLGFLTATSTGAVKKTMEQNVEKIETFIAHTIPDLVNVVATVVFMFAIFLSLSLPLALVCFACLLVSFVLQYVNFMGRKARRFTQEYLDTQERMSASAVEYVRGLAVVKVFGQSLLSFRRFHHEIEDYRTFALKVCDSYEPGMVSFTVVLNAILTVVLPTGLLLLSGRPDDVALAAVWLFFIVLGPGVAAPVFKLTFLGGGTREIGEGLSRIERILSRGATAEPAEPRVPTTFDVTFSDVSFAYTDEETGSRTQALRNVSFRAPQGQVTAVVGPSGSGKSTLAALIPRFWDVDAGSIAIGGVDVRAIATEQLMNLVSFVFQETFLFDDTLYENIAVGSPRADRQSVEAAARAAQCHDFIAALPRGYETRVGAGGVRLSGGEAQRLCVARAILKNAPILVLDEATAFADPENEYKMQQALQHLTADKTVIVIAHRLASIAEARNIIVLDEGSVVEEGSHAALLARGGRYRRMWDAYTDASTWELSVKSKPSAL